MNDYSTDYLAENEYFDYAFAVLKVLDGLTLGQIKDVLQRVESIVPATTRFNANATEYLEAVAGLGSAGGLSR